MKTSAKSILFVLLVPAIIVIASYAQKTNSSDPSNTNTVEKYWVRGSSPSGELVYSSVGAYDGHKVPSQIDASSIGNKGVTTKTLNVPIPPDNYQPKGLLDIQLKTQFAFDPLISPDGRYIAFKYGTTVTPGLYRIFVFDRKTSKTTLAVDDYLNYYYVVWSPDSRYIAFFKGQVNPQFYDFGRNDDGQLTLCVCDWHNHKRQIIRSGTSLHAPCSWIGAHDLVFSALEPKDEEFLSNPNYERGLNFIKGVPKGWERIRGQEKRKPVFPSIYRYSPDQQRTDLLVENGRSATVSPDGKKVAFISSLSALEPFSLGTHWKREGSNLYLVVQDVGKPSTRTALIEINGTYPTFYWVNNSKSLLISQYVERGATSRVQISVMDVLNKSMRYVKNVVAKDPGDLRTPYNQPISILSVDSTSSNVMVRIEEFRELPNNKGYANNTSLFNVNLSSGKEARVSSSEDVIGVDWRYSN